MSIVRLVMVLAVASNLLLLFGCGDKAATAPASALLQQSVGEGLYKKNCKVCHAQGINGAPIVGNKKMWGPRAEKGLDTLVEHATFGFGLMPAKGGRVELTESDISAVVEYMLGQIK